MRLFLFLLILNVCCAAQATAPPAGSPPSQSIPVAQENAAKARALIDQAIQALGGQAWLNIQDTTQQGRTYSFHRNEATSAGVLFWRFVKFPDKERVEVTKQRDVAYVYNGDHGFEITFKGTATIEDKLLNDYLRRREHSLAALGFVEAQRRRARTELRLTFDGAKWAMRVEDGLLNGDAVGRHFRRGR